MKKLRLITSVMELLWLGGSQVKILVALVSRQMPVFTYFVFSLTAEVLRLYCKDDKANWLQLVSYTSWFLDAFNYAIHTHMDVLNLRYFTPLQQLGDLQCLHVLANSNELCSIGGVRFLLRTE